MKNRYILYSIFTVITISAAYKATKGLSKDKLSNQLPAIVRLHHAESGAFFCSGVVVNSKIILTAAHCIKKNDKAPLKILVKSPSKKYATWFAEVGNYSERTDVGFIYGDFTGLATMPIETDPNEIHDQLTQRYGNIVACGFPNGGKLSCSKVEDSSRYGFYYGGKGFLFPGMSGGPVINLDTGAVVAVNSAVDGEFIFVAPLIELQSMLDVKL